MSIASSQPIETRRRPPFYGPDQRYVPPTDNGVAVPDPLPGHLELPDENDEIVENFREAAPRQPPATRPSGPSSSGSIPTGILPSATIAESTGSSPTPWNEARSAPTGFMCRAFLPFSMGTIVALTSSGKNMSSQRSSSSTPRKTARKSATAPLTRESSGSTNRRSRAAITRSSSSRPASSKFTSCRRARYRRLAPNKRGHYRIEPLGVDLGVWHGFFWNEIGAVAAMVRHTGQFTSIADERAEKNANEPRNDRRAERERRKAEEERRKAEEERLRADNRATPGRTACGQAARTGNRPGGDRTDPDAGVPDRPHITFLAHRVRLDRIAG